MLLLLLNCILFIPIPSGGLSEADIQTMVRDAEQFAEKDRQRKELIEARNEADTLSYSMEKSLQEHKVGVRGELVLGGFGFEEVWV